MRIVFGLLLLGFLSLAYGMKTEGNNFRPYPPVAENKADCSAIYEGFKYCKCDPSAAYTTDIKVLDVPQKIELNKNNTFQVSIDFKEAVNKTSGKAVVDVYTYKLGIWVPVPCLDGVGSCTFDSACEPYAELVHFANLEWIMKRDKVPHECPIAAKTYTFGGSTKVPNPGFGWLADGEVYAKVTLYDARENINACYEVYAQVENS